MLSIYPLTRVEFRRYIKGRAGADRGTGLRAVRLTAGGLFHSARKESREPGATPQAAAEPEAISRT